MRTMGHMVGQLGSVALALPVPANTVSGDYVLLGTAGLKGVCLTNRATTALIKEGKAAHSLKDGEATVLLYGILYTDNVISEVATIAQFAKVYWNPTTKKVNTTASGNIFLGYALAVVTAVDQSFKVALAPNV